MSYGRFCVSVYLRQQVGEEKAKARATNRRISGNLWPLSLPFSHGSGIRLVVRCPSVLAPFLRSPLNPTRPLKHLDSPPPHHRPVLLTHRTADDGEHHSLVVKPSPLVPLGIVLRVARVVPPTSRPPSFGFSDKPINPASTNANATHYYQLAIRRSHITHSLL